MYFLVYVVLCLKYSISILEEQEISSITLPNTHFTIELRRNTRKQYLSIIFFPAFNRNKEWVLLNDQRFFLVVLVQLLVYFIGLVVSVDLLLLSHRLLLGARLGRVLGRRSGGVIVPTEDGTNHPDLKHEAV